MTGRRAISGLCMLSVLMISTIAVQGASAAGTTLVTCEKVAPPAGEFADGHCKVPSPGGEYKHITVGPDRTVGAIDNTTTGSERSNVVLKATVAGLGVQLEAKKVSATGTLENKEEGAEMWAQGETSAAGIVFEEVTANLGCSVTGLPGGAGKVETAQVKASTKGQGDSLKFEPSSGTKFAEFELSGAGCPAAVKGKYPVFGSATCIPNGATCTFTHTEITTKKSLRLKNATEGPVAGIAGGITLKFKDPDNEGTGEWPVAMTTFP